MIGQTISHYKILEKLGEGGMGVVYKAEDTKLGRCVAMKFLPSHVGEDEEKKSRFIQEARAASVIDHPNIGTIYEINETSDGSMYIVMACYDVDSLKDKIAAGPLEINQAIDFSLQIAQGMAKAHERGIIHRDLKPGNVLITKDGIAKIIDFGLAKLSGGIHLTKSGTTLGTVAYMSPEQARGDGVDARSDIWSLGIMLFEMLTGKLLFRGEFEAALLYSITNENPLPVETFRSALPFDLKLIIARALQKDPKDRYQSMQEVIGELKTLQSKSQITDATGQIATDSDWKNVTKTIRYLAKKHKVTFVWIPLLVIFIALIGFIIKTFIIKPPSTTLSKSIAIIPFMNIGETEQSYLSDGIADEITDDLSDIPQLLVISRKSSALFRDSKLSDSTIAEQLGVNYLLKGNMQALVARIKLKFSLFDSRSNKEIWKENFDLARGEIFMIKNKIVKNIAQQLEIDPNLIKPARFQTTPEVYESYLHGIYYRDKQNKDDNLLAITFFSEAVRKDSLYVPAIVCLANAQTEQYRAGWDLSEQHLSDARHLCEKALRLDSNYSPALAQLGIILDLTGNPQEGLNLLLKSYDKEKNNAVALTSIAWIYLFELGEPAKGIMYLKQLQEIDPLDWLTAMNMGVAYAQIQNYPEAIKSFHRSYRLNPEREGPLSNLAYAYERIGKLDSATYYYQLALDKNPMNPMTHESLLAVLLATKKYFTAESILTVGLSYRQDNYQLLYGFGVAYTLFNIQTNARRFFQEGLNIILEKINKNPKVGDLQACAGLFSARLGNAEAAVQYLSTAIQLDSTNEEILMKVTRIYAVLGQKENMLNWFKRARAMNPEYDPAYLRTAMDFEKYRNDPDLLSIARQ
ncbi:MAG: protein kinase [Bacteroidota bacterium]|nr:protein kinase [Bacteroidota bacterium]